MMGRLGGIFTGVQMIVVLLTTASPNLVKRSKSGIKTLYLDSEE
ncbi:TPA: hypothetical protein ACSTLY_003030 [Serratia fonticola]|jgi:hypothetical protein|nr:hypothetical protein [Serratia fonticola]